MLPENKLGLLSGLKNRMRIEREHKDIIWSTQHSSIAEELMWENEQKSQVSHKGENNLWKQ